MNGLDKLKKLETAPEKQEDCPLNEAKVLFVGEGGAGKTSLVKKLKGEEFNPEEVQTHGININNYSFQKEETAFKSSLWDFGGQDIMLSTHQFFLSKRSLYILVLDGRKDEKVEYWLNLIKTFGKDSPILIVINKIDQNPSFKLNQRFLQKKYPKIVNFFRVSCKSSEGIQELKASFEKELSTLKHIKTIWPKSWFEIKKDLEEIDHDYISHLKYTEICKSYEVNDSKSQEDLLDFLVDLGVMLHFPGPDVGETNVIRPEWATEGVYKILNSQQLADGQGVFHTKYLKEVLPQEKYPDNKGFFILALMEKFKLCFRLEEKDQILIPDLLAVEEPELKFEIKNPAKLVLEYSFLPKSVMPRFMVKMNQKIKKPYLWRTGVVLEIPPSHSTISETLALIRVDEDERKVTITFSGEKEKEKESYIETILKAFRDINGNSFENPLEVKEKIPIPNHEDILVEIAELYGLLYMKKKEFLSGKLSQSFNIRELLKGTEIPPPLNLSQVEGKAQTRSENLFVLKADIKGFSKFMEEGRGEVITEELESIIQGFQNKYKYAKVSDGDSVTIIHDEIETLSKIALRLSEDIEEVLGKPQLRIAIDFGKVKYEELGEKIKKIKGGDPLRTAARLEPLMIPGQVWCTEIVKSMLGDGGKYKAIEITAKNAGEKLEKFYDQEKRKFNIKKEGSSEDDFWMKLYKITAKER